MPRCHQRIGLVAKDALRIRLSSGRNEILDFSRALTRPGVKKLMFWKEGFSLEISTPDPILTKNGDSKKTAKGVSQRVSDREIKHEDYKRCLIYDEEMYHNMVKIGHTHHQLETQDTLKKSVSP